MRDGVIMDKDNQIKMPKCPVKSSWMTYVACVLVSHPANGFSGGSQTTSLYLKNVMLRQLGHRYVPLH
jgi:hypothetical protein